MFFKYLILLVICGLCHAKKLAPGCASTGVWGRPSVAPVYSDTSYIPSQYVIFRLEIPSGYNVCLETPTRFFVGEEVVVCDHTGYLPSVSFENGQPNSVLVRRHGFVQTAATSYTIYYCDNIP